MTDDRNRNTPPGEDGIEGSCQEPCTEKVIDLFGFIRALLGCEDAGDPGKVDAAERDCQDGCPAETCKREVTQHIPQGKLGGAVVEDLEGKQCTDNHHAPG